jgi:hypothetical protein
MPSQRNHGRGKGGRDQWLAALATDQGGVVSLDQLRRLEITRRAASHRSEAGRLQRVHRGVYTVGHRSIGRVGALRAALLACGDGSVISHGTAAAFWGLRDQLPVLIDVTVRCETGRKIDGIRCRRCRYPSDEEIIIREGVAFTTPSRTQVDLAGILGTSSLRRVVERAAVLKLLDLDALDEAIKQSKGRRGIKSLKLILEDWRTEDGSVPDLRSDFEALVLPRLIARGLPHPVCNKALEIEGHRITPDFLWEELRVVVETDGEGSHGTPVAFQRDRQRDQILVASGYRVARATWRQMHRELDAVVARISRTLDLAASQPSSGLPPNPVVP